MSTNELIERAAKAVWDRRGKRWESVRPKDSDIAWLSWEDENEQLREDVRGEARAVLIALRDPTDEMLDAASHANLSTGPMPPERIVWQAMIDEAAK